jgi:hypothetical protein
MVGTGTSSHGPLYISLLTSQRLHLATREGKQEMVQFLLEKDKSLACIASKNGRVLVIRKAYIQTMNIWF